MSATAQELAAAAASSAAAAKLSAEAAAAAQLKIDQHQAEINRFINALVTVHTGQSSGPPAAPPVQPIGQQGKHLSSYLDDFYFFSGKASEVNRSLALAGIGAIWIFKFTPTTTGAVPQLPAGLQLPLLILVGSLALDLLHYLSGSIFWGTFYEVHLARWKKAEKKHQSLPKVNDLKAPKWLSYPLWVIFFAKIAAMVLAYLYLFNFILSTYCR